MSEKTKNETPETPSNQTNQTEQPQAEPAKVVEVESAKQDAKQDATDTPKGDESTKPVVSKDDGMLNFNQANALLLDFCLRNERLLKPSDVKVLYVVLLMEYLDTDFDPKRDPKDEKEGFKIPADCTIKLPKDRVTRLITLYLQYNNYFYATVNL